MLVQIVLLLCMIVGIFTIGYSIIVINRSNKIKDESIADIFDSINKSLSDINEYNDEFNELAVSVFKELDEKYQEALVLYELIESKREEIVKKEQKDIFVEIVADVADTSDVVKIDNVEQQGSNIEKRNKNQVFEKKMTKKAQDIIKLYDNGLSVEEVAKQMNIGKGEVQLVVNLREV